MKIISKLTRFKRKLKITTLSEHKSLLKYGLRRRLYKNKKGQKFYVKRNKLNNNFYDVEIISSKLGPNATAVIELQPNNTIEIHELKVDETKKTFEEQKGHGFFEVVLDECRQLAIKKIPTKTFTIKLQPINGEVGEYYQRFGFKYVDNVTLTKTFTKTK